MYISDRILSLLELGFSLHKLTFESTFYPISVYISKFNRADHDSWVCFAGLVNYLWVCFFCLRKVSFFSGLVLKARRQFGIHPLTPINVNVRCPWRPNSIRGEGHINYWFIIVMNLTLYRKRSFYSVTSIIISLYYVHVRIYICILNHLFQKEKLVGFGAAPPVLKSICSTIFIRSIFSCIISP